MGDVSRVFRRIGAGEAVATEQLLPLVYDELRKLAAHKLGGERSRGRRSRRPRWCMEAYVRLVDGELSPGVEFPCSLLRRRRGGHAAYLD